MFSSALLNWIFLFVMQVAPVTPSVATPKSYSTQHKEALSFCQSHHFNTSFYFLLDFSLHSGKNRFFVYQFSDSSIVCSGLVTHGACDVFSENPSKYSTAEFSNQVDSHCSSEGKYKIGKRDYSSWGIGIKYWLHGMEKTNSNAQKRVVVLHSWEAVPDEESYPEYSALSWGCPAVSNQFMRTLDQLLSKQEQSTLLWIIK
jgi:hypothetical protein